MTQNIQPFQENVILALGASEMARALSIARSTLFRWVEDGFLPPPRRVGGRLLWIVEEVRDALQKAPPVGSQSGALSSPHPQADPRPKRGRPSKARLMGLSPMPQETAA